MMLPGRTAEGMGALVRLLAPDTRATVYHHDRCRIPLKQPVAMSTCQPVSLKHRPVMGTHATDVNGGAVAPEHGQPGRGPGLAAGR